MTSEREQKEQRSPAERAAIHKSRRDDEAAGRRGAGERVVKETAGSAASVWCRCRYLKRMHETWAEDQGEGDGARRVGSSQRRLARRPMRCERL